MGNELQEGIKLEKIRMADHGIIWACDGGRESLTVRLQPHGEGYTPWAESVHNDGQRTFYNLALARSVTLLHEKRG